jgi:death-on-curing protein
MRKPIWLDATMVRAMHSDQIREHGGAPGVRDPGMLDSALARAQRKWHHDRNLDVAALAAAYGFGLARNHAFIDGNKRIALIAIYVFLALNARELEAEESDAMRLILGVADGSISENDLAAWIREHLIRYRS